MHRPSSWAKPNLLINHISTSRSTVEIFAASVHQLALKVAGILAEVKLGCHNNKAQYFAETCRPSSCFLRLSRYPPCPKYPSLYGIVPHTDSDFLTVLHQDEIAGLQMIKDGRWITVRPISHALIINIGDLFQVHKYLLYIYI